VVVSENLFEKDFQDLDISYPRDDKHPEPLPQNQKLRPFYFMRRIERSI